MRISSEHIFTLITTVLSIFLTYLFTAKHFMKGVKYQTSKDRYDSFYVPYIRKLYSLSPHQSYDYQVKEFLKLFFDNIKFVDVKTAKLFYVLLNAYHESLEPELIDADKYFNNITEAVLKEAHSLSRELKLPDITQPFSEWLD